MMDSPTLTPASTKPPLWFALLLCGILVAAMAWLRLDVYPHTSIPIGYAVPIAIAGWTRNRRLIWGLVCIFIAMTAYKVFYINPNSPAPPSQRIINISLLITDALVVAAVVDLMVRFQASLENRSLELERQTEELANQKQRLQTILDTVPLGIAMVSVGENQFNLNPAGARLLDLPQSNPAKLYPLHEAGTTLRNGVQLSQNDYPVARALQGELISDEEVEVRLRNGRTIVVLISASPIRDRTGAIFAAVSAFVDITPLKELQKQFDLRRREAEEASQRKSRFLATVSHDIRSPANAISLLAELIFRTAKNPKDMAEIPELARELQRSSLSLVSLVSDVLDLNRLDAGGVELHESEFEMSQWLNEECRQLTPLAEQKNLNFKCQAAQPIKLRGDRIKMSRVLVNLVGNAIKFTDFGEVDVLGERLSDGRPRITVRDTGIGIEPEHLSRIFDEFFQLKNRTRDRSRGSGLGLSISKRLVEVMGGQLDVSSAPGQGSTFSVTLPASLVVG